MSIPLINPEYHKIFNSLSLNFKSNPSTNKIQGSKKIEKNLAKAKESTINIIKRKLYS
jgi:hypothetical protein